MLGNVTRPDGKVVTFKYDALGRRIEKSFNGRVHRYLWDGDVVLHEWEYDETERPQQIVAENGDVSFDRPEPTDNLVTWVYDTDSYVPTAKLVNGKRYGIVSDYIGRPVQAYDEHGTPVWQADYDIYGNLLNQKGDRMFVPFRQLGQYEDEETGLYYNRFRYYDPNTGGYISQDPIGLAGNNPTLYAFVKDVNTEVDVFRLNALPETAMAWEKRLVTIPSSERCQAVIGKLHKVAKRNKWKQDKKISKMNNRIVYRDAENKYYAFDTQHGRFEYLDERGHHLGEFDIDGNQTKDADKKGKHNITCG